MIQRFSKSNKPYYIVIGFIITILSLSSCNPQPVDYLDEKEMFSSVERLEQAVLGVYESWYPEYTIRISSLITDECTIGSQNSGMDAIGQSIFRWTFSSDEDDILDPWKNGYEVIGRANKILKGIDGVPVKNQQEEEKRTSLKGELLAIRAYVHFDLYRIYGYSAIYNPKSLAVPYIKESKTTNKPSRPTTEAFFIDLWEDIKTAEILTQKDYEIRMGMTALECLYARVALYTGEYTEAIDYSKKVMDKVSLTPINDFSSIWDDSKKGEVIFKLKRSNVNAIRPGDLFYNINSDKVLFTSSEKMLDSYDSEEDIRFQSWFDENEEEAESSLIISKYEGTEVNQNLNDVKVFRVSEMYLIHAEASLMKNDKLSAQSDLNNLRSNRMSNYSDESFGNTTESILEAILDERYREFPYEGQRYFDLKRLGKSIERSNGDRLDPTSKFYYIPIPQGEVLANPNIRPNNQGW